jgi:hypothetical protein
MFCTPGHVLGGTEGVRSRFHVLRSRTRFRHYGGRRVPFSCFAFPNTFSAVLRASGTVFTFYALGFVFGGTVGVGSLFHVLRSRTRFRRYRGRRVPFSYFVCPDSFSADPAASILVFMFCVPELVFGCTTASGPVFMYCAPGLIFDGAEGVASCFHVLRSRTHFRRYRGRRLPFSCFALPDTFSAVPSASVHVFMFCAPTLFFGGSEGVVSHFHVLRAWTRFLRTEGVGSHFHVVRSRNLFPWFRGLRVPSSYFALPYSFSAVPRASGPVFMFCAPGLIFGGTRGVGSRFHVSRSRTGFRR